MATLTKNVQSILKYWLNQQSCIFDQAEDVYPQKEANIRGRQYYGGKVSQCRNYVHLDSREKPKDMTKYQRRFTPTIRSTIFGIGGRNQSEQVKDLI